MEELGNRITMYRKKLNLTQKELGDNLSVTPQAVSKWENGIAEPDASTIKKMCALFEITTDELLGAKKSDTDDGAVTQTAAETVVTRSADAPAEPIAVVTEQKIINGYCEICKKPVGPGEYTVTHRGRGAGIQHIYCNECHAKSEHNHRLYEYSNQKKQTVKSLIWGGVAGIAALAIFLIAVLVSPETNESYGFETWEGILASFIIGIGFFAFIMQMFWDGAVNDVFFFFIKSFKLPGVIFTLSIDGILFLILFKVIGAVLCAILSVLFFLLGLALIPFISLVILPFAAIKRAHETKKLKAAAQK